MTFLYIIAPAIKEYCLDSTTNWNLMECRFQNAECRIGSSVAAYAAPCKKRTEMNLSVFSLPRADGSWHAI